MSTTAFRIHIGPRWAAFAQARPDATMLGTVQRGMQIGALALLSDGRYAQVNGDVVEVLNASRVRHAMRSQHGTALAPQSAPAAVAAPVVVTIKKRRRLAGP